MTLAGVEKSKLKDNTMAFKDLFIICFYHTTFIVIKIFLKKYQKKHLTFHCSFIFSAINNPGSESFMLPIKSPFLSQNALLPPDGFPQDSPQKLEIFINLIFRFIFVYNKIVKESKQSKNSYFCIIL